MFPDAQNRQRATAVIWMLLLVSIPLLSIFGRDLQRWLLQHYSTQQLAWFIGLVIFALTVLGVRHLLSNGRPAVAWQLLWIVPVFLITPHLFPIVEERIHFIVFGMLGFFSLSLFSWKLAYTICLFVALADEALQWGLADRVGDWRDVGINLLAGWLGATLAVISQWKKT